MRHCNCGHFVINMTIVSVYMSDIFNSRGDNLTKRMIFNTVTLLRQNCFSLKFLIQRETIHSYSKILPEFKVFPLYIIVLF